VRSVVMVSDGEEMVKVFGVSWWDDP
jgi:hypothetical protein